MEPPLSPSPVRVLIRHPPPPTTAVNSADPPTTPLNPNPPHHPPNPTAPEGVVVVGFLGVRPDTDATSLMNRILDANVFGSGDLDKDLVVNDPSGVDWWFTRRRISYHHEADKGIVFLQFSSSASSLASLRDGKFGSDLEESEAGDLRGMLLMFSVCHVIVLLHEGIRFDIQILKKLRMLQVAKHALTSFVRSQITPSSFVSKSTSSTSQPNTSRTSSVSPPSSQFGVASRHSSSISTMSGSGSRPSVLPGQCTPVILFVFEDDFLDGSSPPSNPENLSDPSLLNQSSSSSVMARAGPAGLTLKGPGSVVMLARPISKTEGSFRKKLHSSLEAQIRFLIKKCRILVTTESSHLGPRAATNMSSLPLFTLDASRVVALLDRSMNEMGEPLDFVADVIEESLDSKEALDMFMLEKHCVTINNEDIQAIRDFIYRQSDALRGRGGGTPSNPSSGSVAGVGMVAAAAAAAAASAASGKPLCSIELPSLENWLSSTNTILSSLLSVKNSFVHESGNMKQFSIQDENSSTQGTNDIEGAVSCLETSKGLNTKYSISCCQRALPAAKEVYMKELPDCYPTILHKTQMEKALLAFHSMVKGPVVRIFAKKLVDECTLMWESGRQLCDAVSLTQKPCMHKRHSTRTGSSSSGADVKQHSSGYHFLHACACGRSRRLREDPFDLESANVSFNHFTNCENLLPALVLPQKSNAGPLPTSSWNLVRVGGARYYKPSKGLLQTGFCPTEKFLMKWTISVEKRIVENVLSNRVTPKYEVNSSTTDPKAIPNVDEQLKNFDTAPLPGEQLEDSENYKKSSEIVSVGEAGISFGKGLPSFRMKKAFSEVVAGTVVADSTFPVLQRKEHPKTAPGKGGRQMGPGETDDRGKLAGNHHRSQKTEHVSVQETSEKLGAGYNTNINPFLQIGSNIVPVTMSDVAKTKSNNSLIQVTVYVGFEHECSYGHRFLLSPEHLKELDSSYSSSEKLGSSTEDYRRTYLDTKNGLHENILSYSSETNATMSNNSKRSNSSSKTTVHISQQHDRSTLQDMGKQQSVNGGSVPFDCLEELERNLSHIKFDDGGLAYSLLNRNLPLYMNCPYCKQSVKQDNQKIKFVSTVSQLQRIFLVTPPFPTVLATSPLIQFEDSCLPPSISDRELQSKFGIGCRIILPPESFLTLRLPFIYGVRTDGGSLHSLNYLDHKPELTACLVKGSALQLVSMGHETNE